MINREMFVNMDHNQLQEWLRKKFLLTGKNGLLDVAELRAFANRYEVLCVREWTEEINQRAAIQREQGL